MIDSYSIIRSILFKLEPEIAHNVALYALRLISSSQFLLNFLRQPLMSQPTYIDNIKFPHPVGLAAGLDKNGRALLAWEALGFGFIEIGTITAYPQLGNPKPRLFRFPDQNAIINRFGFNNDGAEKVAARLSVLKESGKWPNIPVGINIGKSKITPLEEANNDYLSSFKKLHKLCDYLVINVSSPNTMNLRKLQNCEFLSNIIQTLKDYNSTVPLFVKLAPDLTENEIEVIIDVALREKLSGIIATNTTLDHSSILPTMDQTGGLSGLPLQKKALEILRFIRTHTQSLPIIGVGGINSALSANERLQSGANLIQIYTGFVYQGPKLIQEIYSQ